MGGLRVGHDDHSPGPVREHGLKGLAVERLPVAVTKLHHDRRRLDRVRLLADRAATLAGANPQRVTRDPQPSDQLRLLDLALRVTGHVDRVRPGQEGYAISNEAKLINAAAVVVGLRYRDGKPLYDKTLQTVLGERPCRVIVVSDRSVHQGADAAPLPA